jgi:heat shock protein HslJ
MLTLGMLAATQMACAEDVMRAETAYFSALESVASWSGTGDELCSRTARTVRCSAMKPR